LGSPCFAEPGLRAGNYNACLLGTTNTSQTKPAALIGDSINILSAAWSDGNSGSSISSRIAADTTVNAALLGGIAHGGGYYSGGVENFPAFPGRLERAGNSLTMARWS